MIRVFILLLLLTSLIPSSATAGPWLREKKTGFLSFSLDIDAQQATDNFASFYVEYGLGHNATVGLERRQGLNDSVKTIAFLRMPLEPLTPKVKLSYEIGLGAVEDEFVLRPGASIGGAWDLGHGSSRRSGWWSWDAKALIVSDLDDTEFKNDFTFGLQMRNDAKFIVQMQSVIPTNSDPYVKLAPSLVIQTSPGRHIQLGVTAGIYEADDVEVNVGLWRAF